MPLKAYDDTYLFVARPIDPRVIDYLQKTQASIDEFRMLEERRFGVQVAFALMYVVIALIVLLSAVWIGLAFANPLVAPIRRLIGAADLVASGNLYVQVPVRRAEGDLAHLGESFNKMTQELRSQRDDLIGAPRPDRPAPPLHRGGAGGRLGRRHRPRRAAGRITILNRSAEALARHRREPRRSASRSPRWCPSSAPLVDGCARRRQPPASRARSRWCARVASASCWCGSPASTAADAEPRLRRHPRRHHRPRHRPAHLGLGRRRPPHRPRDQEPADADPALRRAPQAQVRQGDHRRPRDLRPVHRHHRPPGRRHRPHGRRVLRPSPACPSRRSASTMSARRCGRRCS